MRVGMYTATYIILTDSPQYTFFINIASSFRKNIHVFLLTCITYVQSFQFFCCFTGNKFLTLNFIIILVNQNLEKIFLYKEELVNLKKRNFSPAFQVFFFLSMCGIESCQFLPLPYGTIRMDVHSHMGTLILSRNDQIIFCAFCL